jgi:predicted metal-dependent hydrolase
VAFLKIANRGQSVKLCREIAKLSTRIEEIDIMPYLKQIEPIDEFLDEKPSKLNTQTTETKTDMRNQKRNSPENQHPIHDEAKDSRNRALQLASEHKDIKPIKYLLKN